MIDLISNRSLQQKGIKEPRSELTVSRGLCHVPAFALFVGVMTGHGESTSRKLGTERDRGFVHCLVRKEGVGPLGRFPLHDV